MMEEHKNPWQTVNINKVYENKWIEVSHRDVLNPAGNPGIYGIVHFKNIAVGVIPLDEHHNTWLVGQYRYALDQYSWEIPEGGCPLGTSPLATAQRELSEEVGIKAQKWTEILQMDISNSVTDEKAVVFIAQELHFGTASPEETEQLQTRKLPFQEALQLVLDGIITDSLSVAGILKLHLLLQKNTL